MHCYRDVRRCAYHLGVLFVLCISAALRADEGEAIKGWFEAEAPSAWKEYQAYAERLQGKVETVGTVEGKLEEKKRLEFRSNPKCRLTGIQTLLPKPDGRVYAYNDSYSFTLERKTSDGPWALTKYRSGPKDMSDWKPGASSQRSICIRTTTSDLLEVVKLPKFRVVEAKKVQRGGGELCQVGYETHGGQGKGTLLLDPSRFWTLREYTLHRKDRGGSVVNRVGIEVRDPSAKYPIPKRWVLHVDATPLKDPKFQYETVMDFDLREVSRPPGDEEFTLSAFGLPEPGGHAAKRTPWYLWIAGGAALSALLTFGFRHLRQRRATSIRP